MEHQAPTPNEYIAMLARVIESGTLLGVPTDITYDWLIDSACEPSAGMTQAHIHGHIYAIIAANQHSE